MTVCVGVYIGGFFMPLPDLRILLLLRRKLASERPEDNQNVRVHPSSRIWSEWLSERWMDRKSDGWMDGWMDII